MGCNNSTNQKLQQEEFIANFPETENNIYLIQKETNDYMDNRMKKLMTINIMVVGITGVGKSTFLNSYFNSELAETSFGCSCTNEIKHYSNPSKPLSIYDTPGFELDPKRQKQIKDSILKKIKEKNNAKDKKEHIHIILFCVNHGSGRLQTEEENFMKQISKCCSEPIPIIIVITKSFNDRESNEFKNHIINRHITNVRHVVPIIAKESRENYCGNEVLIKPKGEEDLIHAIDDCLPEHLKTLFNTVKKATMINKRQEAKSQITLSTTCMLANTINDSNFWQLFYLLAKNMISKIAIIYEINVNSDFQNNFLLYTIGEETPSIQNPVIFSHYREEINTFAALSDEEIQSPQMSAIITNSLGMTYIIFIEKIFLNENYLDEIGRDQLKNEIKNEFTIKLQKSNFSYV